MSLRREISLMGLTMIAIGSCVGSGIFLTPADSMKALGHSGWVLLVWAIGGLITFLGAITFSELGSRYPKSGGVYVYLKEAYGDIFGFLYGWIILFIVNTGALAALATAFAGFLKYYFPISDTQKTVVAIAVIIGLTLMNVIGVGVSQMFAKLFTGLKLVAIVAIIGIGAYYAMQSSSDHVFNLSTSQPTELMESILLAFVGVFWSFGGWHHATYLSGEVKRPARNVPMAMLLGTAVVTIVYLLVIWAYMMLLSPAAMANSTEVAGDAVNAVIQGGGKLVTLAITISIFGTIGIYTMTAPRIYHAMADDGLFFQSLSKLHPKYRTPYVAMLFQMVWACILILIWGSFSSLITFVTFMDIVFMALATASIFVFRSRSKGLEDPSFKVPFYPIVPLLFLIVTVAFVINTMIALPNESWAGVVILLLGVVAYFFFNKRRTD